MNNIDNQLDDPVLRGLIKQDNPPGIPEAFTRKVMDSIQGIENPVKSHVNRIPAGIKLGIPLFLLTCSLLLIFFPGEQSGIFDSLTRFISDPGFIDFFDKMSLKVQSFQSPEIVISRNLGAYIIGGIGLIWMFVISESLSRRFSKN